MDWEEPQQLQLFQNYSRVLQFSFNCLLRYIKRIFGYWRSLFTIQPIVKNIHNDIYYNYNVNREIEYNVFWVNKS